MEREYEKIADIVKTVLEGYEEAVKAANNTANKVMADWRFSPAGKENAKKEVYADLHATADNMTKIIKEAAEKFCDTYKVKLPSDNKDHGMDIANALKVIDMLGFNMTVESLKTILEPLKTSYKHMKMIADIIFTKSDSVAASAGAQYNSNVISLVHEYLGGNTKVLDYLDLFRNIEEISTVDSYKLDFSVVNFSDATVLTITPTIPYAIYTLSDLMIKTGEMYAELENEVSGLFKEHIPTDQELLESALK